METRDVLAAVGTAALVFVGLAGFDLARGQEIAWLLDSVVALGIGGATLYLRATVDPVE